MIDNRDQRIKKLEEDLTNCLDDKKQYGDLIFELRKKIERLQDVIKKKSRSSARPISFDDMRGKLR